MPHRFFWKIYFLILIPVATSVLIAGIFSFFQAKRTTRIVFLDVGEGNAVLVQDQGKNILIDGGPDKSILEKLDYFLPFYRRKLDLVVSLSHRTTCLPGLIEVVKNYPVGKILDYHSGESNQSDLEKLWLKVAKGKSLEYFNSGRIIYLNQNDNLKLLIFSEKKGQKEGVAYVALNNQGFLLTPGIYQKDEKWLMRNFLQPVNVWQVPRQGVRGSVSQEFLARIKPMAAIIQTGQNRFKKLNWQTIKMLENAKIKIQRTDIDGDIVFQLR